MSGEFLVAMRPLARIVVRLPLGNEPGRVYSSVVKKVGESLECQGSVCGKHSLSLSINYGEKKMVTKVVKGNKEILIAQVILKLEEVKGVKGEMAIVVKSIQ